MKAHIKILITSHHHINYISGTTRIAKNIALVGFSKNSLFKVKQISDPCFKRKLNIESAVRKIKTFHGINVSRFTSIWMIRHTQSFFFSFYSILSMKYLIFKEKLN